MPRAKLHLCVREPGGLTDVLNRTEQLTAVTPGAEIPVKLTAEEAQGLPADTDLEVLACLRWPGAKGLYQATCSQTVVVASRVQVRDRGDVVGTPVELTDMNRFRGFWNKVWTSPTTGGRPRGAPAVGAGRGPALLRRRHPGDRGNGLMETRLQEEPGDEGLRAKTQGRIKSGLEVSVAELNKLLPLWPGEQPLAVDDLAAFAARGWLAGQGGDAVAQVRMEGKRGTRGLLWVVPVVRLRAFTLAQATEVDPYGQAIATQDRSVHFPVVESVRLLGLASLRDASEAGESADVGTDAAPATYRFDGYDVVLNNLVGLEPAGPLPRAGG